MEFVVRSSPNWHRPTQFFTWKRIQSFWIRIYMPNKKFYNTSFYARLQNCEKRLLASSYLPFVCPSVCLSVRMEQLGSHWTDFHEIWYFSIFRKYVEEIQVSLKSDNNKVYFTWPNILFLSYLTQFFLEWEMLETKIVEKNQNTHFMFSNFFPKIVPFMW
jgi:hypothetical protein